MKAMQFLTKMTGSKYYEAKLHFEYLEAIDESQLSSQQRMPLIRAKRRTLLIMQNEWGRVIDKIGLAILTALLFPMLFCFYKVAEILLK